MHTPPLKIGLFAIGLDTYWDQFPGLQNRLEDNLLQIYTMIQEMHPHVINAGMVDTVDKAFGAGSLFRREEVDLIFLYVTTYALSATVLPVVQRVKVPVIILNLSPELSIDYAAFNNLPNRTAMTGEWLAFCSPCPVPEIANVFKRTGIPFQQVTGLLHSDPHSREEISEWIAAAGVAHTLFYNRMGCMGHYYSGMLDIYTDITLQAKYFGGHYEMLEVDELAELRQEASETDIEARAAVFYERFEMDAACSLADVREAALTAVALDKLVDRYSLGSLAYYYKGAANSANQATISSIILGTSLLTGRGIPVAGEYEIKNAQAMKIMDSFDAGGSFTEYYAMDYSDDIIIMGHDGPGHVAIAEGRVRVKPLQVYHGKVGAGLSVEMTVQHGPITCLSVVETGKGELMLLVAEGASVAGPTLQMGNTNSRYRFTIGARAFVQQWNSHGPAHHCAVGKGHIASKIKKLGALLQMEVIVVG